MRSPEDELIQILKGARVDVVSTLPCERIKNLLMKVGKTFENVPLTREEAGVGISAGVALAGRRPAMIIQNSGIGNMINALLSLTSFYKLPLALFLSHRGMYKERIAAQRPMGEHVGKILKAAGIGYSSIKNRDELYKIREPLERTYRGGRIHAFLLSPKVWEFSSADSSDGDIRRRRAGIRTSFQGHDRLPVARFTRFEVIERIAPLLKGKIVVCNLGFPAKELYHIVHQPTNFYMLGSMGMASPIGYGLAISCTKEVIVIDGDGSLLMNPGTLSTIALKSPGNLSIIAIDNGVYSSTGDQLTATHAVANLSIVAKGFGLKKVFTVARYEEIVKALTSRMRGPKFVHVIARRGNRSLPNIPLSSEEIKDAFMREIALRRSTER